MTWTTDKPTEPGIYQYRPPDAGLFVFYRIRRSPNGELVAIVDKSLEHLDLQDLPGLWRGPITDVEAWR